MKTTVSEGRKENSPESSVEVLTLVLCLAPRAKAQDSGGHMAGFHQVHG